MGNRSKKPVKQKISLFFLRLLSIMHQLTLQPQPGTGRRRQRTEIRLHRPRRQDFFASYGNRLPKDIFQAPDLIPSRSKPGHIVSFYISLYIFIFRKTRKCVKRRRRSQ